MTDLGSAGRGELAYETAAGRRSPRVVFQYNPDAIRHHARPGMEGGPGPSVLRTAAFTLEFDARDPDATSGITSAKAVGAAIGRLQRLLDLSTASAPGRPARGRVIFVWQGAVTPVRITALTVVEEDFDAVLHPARAVAEVLLSLEG